MMQWYALHTKPQKESLVAEQLDLRNIELYSPMLRVNPVNPRARKVRPYFPGYIFVHVDLSHVGTSTLQWIPGAHKIVAYGNEPACVPKSFIQMLQRKLGTEEFVQIESFYGIKHGDQVMIKSGLFIGYRAVFDKRLSGEDRVRLLLQMLQDRQVSVEISGEVLEKI